MTTSAGTLPRRRSAGAMSFLNLTTVLLLSAAGCAAPPAQPTQDAASRATALAIEQASHALASSAAESPTSVVSIPTPASASNPQVSVSTGAPPGAAVPVIPAPPSSPSVLTAVIIEDGFITLGYREADKARAFRSPGNVPSMSAGEHMIEIDVELPPGTRPVRYAAAIDSLISVTRLCGNRLMPAAQQGTGRYLNASVPYTSEGQAPDVKDGHAFCAFALPQGATGKVTVSQPGGDPRPLPMLLD